MLPANVTYHFVGPKGINVEELHQFWAFPGEAPVPGENIDAFTNLAPLFTAEYQSFLLKITCTIFLFDFHCSECKNWKVTKLNHAKVYSKIWTHA
jgi:hypothetical protein